jgi:Gram-negative bacterial TonB protein C-terminal
MRKPVLLLLIFTSLPFHAISQYDTIRSIKGPGDTYFDRVEVEAQYKGGVEAWKRYIEQNLRYPEEAKKHFHTGSEQRVKTEFSIGADSVIKDIIIKDDPGYGFKEEIIRVLTAAEKWQPTRQNGKDVMSYKKQEFIFRYPDPKDTMISVRGFTCNCKYNFNIEDDNKIFDRSEKPATYPGGDEAWKKFVKKNLDKSIKGNEKVEVRFQVDKKRESFFF